MSTQWLSLWVWVASFRMVFLVPSLPENFQMSLVFSPLSSTPLCMNVYVYHIFFIHSSVPTILNNAAVNTVEQMSLWCECVSFGYMPKMPKSGIAGSCNRFIPNFLRNHHTDFQSGCTSLHSHQQWMLVPLTPNFIQHRLPLMFLILAIQNGIRWCLRVVLICISLMAKDAGNSVKYFLAT